MEIEVKNILVFDEKAERRRINNVFHGAEKAQLLDILDRFIAGKFSELAKELPTWGRDFREFLHTVIYDVLSAELKRQREPEPNVEAERILTEFLGRPVNTRRTDYPKFEIL